MNILNRKVYELYLDSMKITRRVKNFRSSQHTHTHTHTRVENKQGRAVKFKWFNEINIAECI